MTDATNAVDPIPRVLGSDEAAGSGSIVAENIKALKALFPTIVTDGRVDFEVLRQLLGDVVEDGEERYGLNWKGKREARAFALTPSTGTLRPAKGDSVDWDTTRNIIIEGDNLEVLKLLRRSYAKQVNVIYIDPPYNTGKDFIYPDDYRDSIRNYDRITGRTGPDGTKLTTNKETSGRYHGVWLNMLYPRLLLAQELLRDDGVLLISIDDHEYERVAILCSEIFGETNHLSTFVWKRKAGGGDDSGHVAAEHEYVLCFAKDESRARIANILHESPAMTAKYNRRENDRRYYLERLDKTSLTYNKSLDYAISAPDGTRVFPPQPDPANPTTIWRWGSDTAESRRGELVFIKDEKAGEWRIYTKTWESLDGVTPRSLLVDKAHGRNRDGTQELDALLGPKVFSNPKPTKMLRHLLQIAASDPNALVVDFFAGSGSIGHGVLAQNAEDGGARRYMLIQLPEPLDPETAIQKAGADLCDKLGKPRTIAELTKERIRRAGAKLRASHLESTLDTGFRSYKLGTSNLKPWDPDPHNLEASLLDAVDNVLPGRTEDDLLVELLLKTGIDLSMPSETRVIAGLNVHALGGGVLMVCLGAIGDNAEALGDGMADWRAGLAPPRATTFYFRDSGFASAVTKANLAAILKQRIGKADIAKLASL